MDFYDLATRLTDRIRPVREADLAVASDIERRLLAFTGGDETLVISTWSSERWYKFWMLTDGTLIPVKHAHSDTIADAANSTGTRFGTEHALRSGIIRGHIDEEGGFMSVTTMIDLTDDQIERIKKLYVKYGCNTFRLFSREKPDMCFDRSGEDLNHIDYILRYGPGGMDEKRKLKEDGADAGAGSVNGPTAGGMTTEDDISALPIEIGRRRRRRKRTPVIGMKEAVDEDLGRLRKELKQQMVKLMNREEFQVTADAVRSFQSVFGTGHPRTQRVAIKIERQQRDAQKLYGDILREHGDDRGSLEMVIAAMQDGRPLGQFAGMSKYDYLYGTRVEITFQGVDLVFEATVDFIYDATESLYVGDEEVADEVEKNYGHEIKRKKNLLYPVGGHFKDDFFGRLKEMIEDSGNNDRDNDTK